MHRTESQYADCERAIHVLPQTMEEARWSPSGGWCGWNFAGENDREKPQSEHDRYRGT